MRRVLVEYTYTEQGLKNGEWSRSRSGNDGGVAEGYDVQLFVELPPKDLLCTKCEKVLREPHQAECGHLYCGQCILAIAVVGTTDQLELTDPACNHFRNRF